MDGMRALAAAVAADLGRHGLLLAALFSLWHVPLGLARAALLAVDADPMAATMVDTLLMAALYVPLLGGASLLAVPRDGRQALAHASAAGVRRWFALFPAWLVYSNRLAVGVVLGVLPGLIWFVQGRFLAQAAALRPDVPPFEHSRAVLEGAWWPAFALTLVSVGTQLGPMSWSDFAVAAVTEGEVTGYAHAVGSALLAGALAAFWCVVDTRWFLDRERRRGLAPPAVATS